MILSRNLEVSFSKVVDMDKVLISFTTPPLCNEYLINNSRLVMTGLFLQPVAHVVILLNISCSMYSP